MIISIQRMAAESPIGTLAVLPRDVFWEITKWLPPRDYRTLLTSSAGTIRFAYRHYDYIYSLTDANDTDVADLIMESINTHKTMLTDYLFTRGLVRESPKYIGAACRAGNYQFFMKYAATYLRISACKIADIPARETIAAMAIGAAIGGNEAIIRRVNYLISLWRMVDPTQICDTDLMAWYVCAIFESGIADLLHQISIVCRFINANDDKRDIHYCEMAESSLRGKNDATVAIFIISFVSEPGILSTFNYNNMTSFMNGEKCECLRRALIEYRAAITKK
jgi:hypothetical protein